MRLLVLPTAACIFLAGCGPRADSDASAADASAADAASPAAAFLAALDAHCGKAYEGHVVDPQPVDSAMADARLVMHVRGCGVDSLRIPFHVGDDRSRTWVLTRTAEGVRLKHDHRHEDGSEDRITQYGGTARPTGTATTMEFPADSFTAALIPAAASNVWTIEITPERFVYQLRREGTDRRFRVEFDLTVPVDAPAAPWGAAP